MDPRAERPHQDTDQNRTARDSEPDRDAHSGNRDRKAAQNQSEHKPDENEQQIRIAKFLFLIAKHFRHAINRLLLTHYRQFIPNLKPQVTGREQVDSSPVHTRDVDPVGVAQMQFPEFRTVDARLGHENVPRDKHPVQMVPVDVLLVPVLHDLLPEQLLGSPGIRLSGENKHMLPLFQHGVPVRDDHLTAAFTAIFPNP